MCLSVERFSLKTNKCLSSPKFQSRKSLCLPSVPAELSPLAARILEHPWSSGACLRNTQSRSASVSSDTVSDGSSDGGGGRRAQYFCGLLFFSAACRGSRAGSIGAAISAVDECSCRWWPRALSATMGRVFKEAEHPVSLQCFVPRTSQLEKYSLSAGVYEYPGLTLMGNRPHCVSASVSAVGFFLSSAMYLM